MTVQNMHVIGPFTAFGSPSTPAQLVQAGVRNTEMMGYFMDDRPRYDVDQFGFVASDTRDRPWKTVMRSGMAPP